MLAIPNMEKPKGCWDCFNADCNHWGEHGYDNSTDCPLIEIPDEIWEALKPKVDTMSMALKGWVEDVLKSKNGFGVDN